MGRKSQKDWVVDGKNEGRGQRICLKNLFWGVEGIRAGVGKRSLGGEGRPERGLGD